jgi:hypothetical protein
MGRALSALDDVCRAADTSRATTLLQVALAVTAGALTRTDLVTVAARVGSGPWRQQEVDLTGCRTLADAVRLVARTPAAEVTEPADDAATATWTAGSLTVRIDESATGRTPDLPALAATMLGRVAEQALTTPDVPLPELRLVSGPERERLIAYAGHDTPVPRSRAPRILAR